MCVFNVYVHIVHILSIEFYEYGDGKKRVPTRLLVWQSGWEQGRWKTVLCGAGVDVGNIHPGSSLVLP